MFHLHLIISNFGDTQTSKNIPYVVTSGFILSTVRPIRHEPTKPLGIFKCISHKAKKKYMCVYCHMSKKSMVGRSGLIFFFLLSAKPEIVIPESDSVISFSKFLVK